MKLVIDNKIPYIREAAQILADDVVYAPGKEFTTDLVRDADALIVRTRTQCNRALLEGSRVKFIATATIGFDHIDTAYCQSAGIGWSNAPGCNSSSVAQYVQSSLLVWKIRKNKKLEGMTLGIVGAGNVGSKVAQVAQEFGMNVLLNDPPKEEQTGSRTGNSPFSPLKQLAEKCDIITFHVPLYPQGKFKTFHLADEDFFRSLKRKPLLINTSRGEVVDTDALLQALDDGSVSDAIIDVWEQEPDINLELLQKAFLATPHIAGYSADGKGNATRMALDAVCNFFHKKIEYTIEVPPPSFPVIRAKSHEEALLQIYDPTADSNRLKTHPEQFEALRGNYPLRREEKAYSIIIDNN